MNMATKHEILAEHLQEWMDSKGDKIKRGLLTKELAKATKMHPKSIGRSWTQYVYTANAKQTKDSEQTWSPSLLRQVS